ncbi:MAG: hypothetical protein LUC88_08060 [Prevotella sp.]|nr:hypothetical protein [Prevotella sp.]
MVQSVKREGWAYWFKSRIVRLSRLSHSQGFGVQSPWAFKMVRNVINGREHHEEYDRLRYEYPRLRAMTRKLCELSFRLSSYVQPRNVIDFGESVGPYEAYIKAGYREANCILVPCEEREGEYQRMLSTYRDVDMLRLGPFGDFHRFAQLASLNVRNGSVFMIEGIHESKEARALWKEILRDWQNVVTFDLYYCGLVFFDAKRYKQNYIINF